jgi:hypothetical protein
MLQNAQPLPAPSEDRREFSRVVTTFPGKLFLPAEQITLDCQVINLSAGGAGIRCDEPPPLQSFVVLYIEGFGRFQGVATRYEAGELGMCFVCREAKRERLKRDLAAYVQDGQLPATRLRAHHRAPSSAIGHFIRHNGEQVRCDVLDISLQGLSLRTDSRPPVGEIINLGQSWGRVVRHHPDGIALQFLKLAHDAQAEDGH